MPGLQFLYTAAHHVLLRATCSVLQGLRPPAPATGSVSCRRRMPFFPRSGRPGGGRQKGVGLGLLQIQRGRGGSSILRRAHHVPLCRPVASVVGNRGAPPPSARTSCRRPSTSCRRRELRRASTRSADSGSRRGEAEEAAHRAPRRALAPRHRRARGGRARGGQTGGDARELDSPT
jgi:hypothetical protein